MPPVSPTIAVASASEEPVIQAGASRVGVANSDWPLLPLTSSVVQGKAVSFVDSNFNKTANAAILQQLADYLALSTCCHALDGWRYLSQASLALMTGARNQALHLAYYAELRAALSILASSGIGILNSKHFSLDSTGNVNWFAGNTHPTAWKCLTEWSHQPDQAKKLMKCFQALGLSASEWAEACSATGSLDAIAQNWLENWSIDLSKVGNDRLLRNEASYRPDLHSNAMDCLIQSDVEFVGSMGALCVPAGSGYLDDLDIMLIVDLCRKACELRYGDSSDPSMRSLAKEVFGWLLNHKVADPRDAGEIIRTLGTVNKSPGSAILTQADPSNASPAAVTSRAFLLLRLASALTRKQWEEIQLRSAGGIAVWQRSVINAYGLHSNLWDSTTPPLDFATLDEDRSVAQENVGNWIAANTPFNPYRLWRDLSTALVDLCRFERVGIVTLS